MMMTCRLLCALLVLALCCCLSVFAKEEEDNRSKDSAAQENISGKNGEQNGTDGSSPLTSKKSAKENENGTQEIQDRPTDVISNSEGASGDPGKTSNVDQSEKKKELEDPVEKTTTTTTTTTTT
ncbi:mucin, putative, partial [Trypanosoma cruzi]